MNKATEKSPTQGECLPPGVTLRKLLRMAAHFRVCGCHRSNTVGIHGKSWDTYAALKKAVEAQRRGPPPDR